MLFEINEGKFDWNEYYEEQSNLLDFGIISMFGESFVPTPPDSKWFIEDIF